jgi:hypothetical protein
MSKSFFCVTILLLMGASPCTWAASEIPLELIGEWATSQTEFERGAVSKGTAIYVRAEGIGMIISAPPPIGAKGAATFDKEKRLLTMKMSEGGKSMGVFQFLYDPKKKTLKSSTGAAGNTVFSRRRDRVPKHVLDEMK